MRSFDEIAEDHRVTVQKRAADGIALKFGRHLFVIASNGGGWDHASVTVDPRFGMRCPSWSKMDAVRGLVWDDEECVMQLHVPRSEHVDCHPHCLHLWRPQRVAIPRPPSIFVGPQEVHRG